MIYVVDILKEKGNDYFGVPPETITLEALKLMAEKNIGAVLVVKNDNLEGIFSERDYARKIVLFGKSSANTQISEFMSVNLTTVYANTKLTDCMQIMTDKHIRHLPVVDNDKIIGLVSIGDIVSRIIREQKNTIQQLENYITGG
jgi:CBS domain-containing protein